MNKQRSLVTSILTFLALFVIFLAINRSVFGAPLSQLPTPTPTIRPAPSQLPFPVRAPWPAGIIWHAGSDGSFYGDFMHTGTDSYAVDFNGSGDNGETVDNDVLVLSVADGWVSKVDNVAGYGNYVVISHGLGFQSRYAHLRDIPLVQEDTWIAQGAPIGYVGKTGGNYGKHLHFAMYYCDPNYLIYDTTSQKYKCGKNNEKIQPMRPELFDQHGTLNDGDQITSHNYGIGYEEMSGDNLYDAGLLFFHDSFYKIYEKLGGHFVFGLSETPVQLWQGTNIRYQSFEEVKRPGLPWDGMRSALFEKGNIAYLMLGPVWERYKQEAGPSGRLGLPVSHTYEYGYLLPSSGGAPNYRADFENGSIISSISGQTEILDASSGNWKARIYADTAFQNLNFQRYDKYIDYKWKPEPLDNLLINAHLGPGVIWEGKSGGWVTFYRIAVKFQGHVEILVNGKQALKVDSPDQEKVEETLEFGWREEQVEIRFWQDIGKTARIQVSTRNVFPVPEAFASEGALEVKPLPDSALDYPVYEAPPFPGLPPVSTPIIPPSAGGNTSTIFVIDVSGSMAEPWQGGIKIESAKSAANQIIYMLEQESKVSGVSHRAGLATFTTDASLLLGLSSDYNQIRTSIDGLFPQRNTNIGAGITVANQALEQASADEDKIIILLSDGLTNTGLSPDEVLAGPVAQAANAGTCIYTVGFGDPGNLDVDLLQQIAAESGCGEYFYATDVTELEQVYIRIRHVSTGNLLAEFNGTVAQGQTLQAGEFNVPQGQGEMAVSLHWPGSALDLLLLDPRGRTVDQNYRGANVASYPNLVYALIEQPTAGTWQLAVHGREVPEGTTNFNALVSTRQTAITPATTLGPGIVVVLVALVAGGMSVYLIGRRKTGVSTVQRGTKVTSASLVGYSGEFAGKTTNLPPSGVLIGRGTACNLRLSDRAVSRQHARIRFAQGNWFIQDLGSGAGTYVNGARVDATILHPGDRIRLGSTEFEFRQ